MQDQDLALLCARQVEVVVVLVVDVIAFVGVVAVAAVRVSRRRCNSASHRCKCYVVHVCTVLVQISYSTDTLSISEVSPVNAVVYRQC